MADFDATHFPDRPACFGLPGFTNATCTVPTQAMIAFLNITSPAVFKQAYCLNPPQDSCAYGYCPNPDIASPAVRAATYVSSICLSILILYSPDDIVGAFYAQLLSVYSLIISAIIAISTGQLTRLHAIFALTAAGSPLSLYLVLYALRSAFGKVNRLEVAFGEGKIVNRVLVLLMLPLWFAVLIFIALPSRTWSFQQVACDAKFKNHLVGQFFYGPFRLFLGQPVREVAKFVTPLVVFVAAWAGAIYLQRVPIWKKGNRWLPWRRMWRKVVDAYPFIQFCTVVLLPSLFWIATLEQGALFTQEHFSPTYGQLLAVFVAVPPAVQAALLLPRLPRWFADLAWVRAAAGRAAAPRRRRRAAARASDASGASVSSLGSYATLQDPGAARELDRELAQHRMAQAQAWFAGAGKVSAEPEPLLEQEKAGAQEGMWRDV